MPWQSKKNIGQKPVLPRCIQATSVLCASTRLSSVTLP